MSAFLQRVSRYAAPVVLVFAAMLLSACAATEGPQTTLVAQGNSARAIRQLYDIFWIASIIVFVVVEGMLLYSVFRYRRRRGDGIPVQIHGNKPVEIVWTIIPSVIVLVLATATFRTQAILGQEPQDPVRVRVIGHQWWWEFQYPDHGIVTANELHIPANRDIQLLLQSEDVIHSFWLPRLAGKTDTIPGHTNVLVFRAEDTAEPLLIRGQCAEFCGGTHAQMGMYAVVEPQADFDAWVERQKAPAPVPQGVTQAAAPAATAAPANISGGGPQAQGYALFQSKGCVACHAIAGRPDAIGQTGPDLSRVGSRRHIVAGWLENTPDNMRRWLRNPDAVKPDNLMAATIKPGTLSEDEIEALTAYLESLK